MGTLATRTKWAGAALLVALVAASGCRIVAEDEPLGQPVAETDPLAEGALPLGAVDFDNAIYASACGLSWIDVGSGVGEGPSLDGIYGLEVIDVAVSDLDGVPGVEAAVLVDCLGGDTYGAAVLGFDSAGVRSADAGPPVLVPVTGANLPNGHRPVGIGAGSDGSVVVELDAGDGHTERELTWSAHVMSGGELTPVPGDVIHGVVVAGGHEGAIVVSLAPGVGYRLPVVEGLSAVDPDTGVALSLAEMSGRMARVTLDSNAAVASVELLPVGAA